VIKIPKYYELLDKLNRCKKKNKEDTFKLQLENKKNIIKINELNKRIKEIKSKDYFYNLWSKERDERIKDTKESNKLLDEINNLKKELAIKIMAKVLRNKVKNKVKK